MPHDSLANLSQNSPNVTQITYYIVAIIFTIIAIVFNKDIRKLFIKIRKYLRNDNISKYFESNIPLTTQIHLLVYQFGLRPTLPIMDWLYLEFINFLSTKITINKIVIFPTIDKSRKYQSEADFQTFSINVKKIINNINIEIVSPFNDNYFSKEDLVSEEFISTLKYIGSEKYFEFLRREFHININSILDFNKFRVDDDKIKDIYTHIYKGWGIVNYIKRNFTLKTPINVSAIFWEWEADKIGVLKKFSNNNENITLFPILGKTQMLNKKTPVPVFIEEDSICFFDEINVITEMAIRYIPNLSKFNKILDAVLSNYQEIDRKLLIKDGKNNWKSHKISFPTQNNERVKGTRALYVFLGTILKLKSIIHNGNKKYI